MYVCKYTAWCEQEQAEKARTNRKHRGLAAAFDSSIRFVCYKSGLAQELLVIFQTMATPMVCLRSPFSEMLSSYYQLRVMRTSLRARDKKCQSSNSHEITQRARISTKSREEAKQQEDSNVMSSKLLVRLLSVLQ